MDQCCLVYSPMILFMIDLDSEICNFADDNTLSIGDNNLEEVISKLEDDLGTRYHLEMAFRRWDGSKS